MSHRGWIDWGLLLTVLTLTPTGAAGADPSGTGPDYGRSGFYAGLGAVYAAENFSYDLENLGLTGIVDVDPEYDDSAGAELMLGYRMHPNLAVEFVYQFLEGFDSTRGNPETEIDSHAFTLNAKLFVLTGRWQPYAVLGLGGHLVNTEVRDNAVKKPFETDLAFAMRFGGGVDFYLNEHWVVGIEGTYFTPTSGLAGHADFGTVGAHVLLRF